MMQKIRTKRGINISWETQGSGPDLVLVHGGFSDHRTNWEFVMPSLSERFTVHAIARRGRGETDATVGHTLPDEVDDAVEVIRQIGRPVYLLGHSYGAQVALRTALTIPAMVRRLVFYEGPLPHLMSGDALASLGELAGAGDWSGFSFWFFLNVLLVPREELEALRDSDLWAPIVSDARASLGDLAALHGYDFQPAEFSGLRMPVLLQTGSLSPRELYATDALAGVLPNARVEILEGQAHEGMTTGPEQYVESVVGFLLKEEGRRYATTGPV